MSATLRLGSDDAVYLLVGRRRYRVAPGDLRLLLVQGRAVPVMGEGGVIVGHAAVNAAGRAVKVFTVSGHFIVPLVSFRRVATGEARSAPLFPLVPEGRS
ncbi:hypothetical protein [uncultured Methanofollis sp.]|uniref:hypothetical protein n=1 Tax=uncultured Methanofollis sp. TaxID=262500 RepID=UPI0026285577|nr:hypothetical protein [uncultured Methanofollis sp.]